MSRSSVIRFAAVSVAVAAAYTVVVGIPTAIIPNPFFIRMIPAGPMNYVFWIVPALLFGPLLTTYVVPLRGDTCSLQGRMTAGGFLSYLAVGCPICNKVVVLLLGVGGALAYFQPLQPVLGALSVMLLSYGLWLRLRPIAFSRRAAQS